MTTKGQDLMRHSYATYALALHRDIKMLQSAMGHEIKETTLKHYLGQAQKHQAEEYFRIG